MVIGKTSISSRKEEVLRKYSEIQILVAVFPEIKTLPCKINSPFRTDSNPSFSIFLDKEGHVRFKDFGDSQMRGTLIDLLCKYWRCSFPQTISKIESLMRNHENVRVSIEHTSSDFAIKNSTEGDSDIQVKCRNWNDYDYQYWSSYGVSPEWLHYAEVYPISHKIVTKGSEKYVFNADKYAYCFVERKDNQLSLKIYQPFNTNGFKWCGKMNASVWSLWTKIPQHGNNLIIGSSLKDCLNISCQLHIPAICMQGEGYLPKPQIINELKARFRKIIVFFDNDFNKDKNPGREDSMRLAEKYSLSRVEIPERYNAKDPSDLYKKYGKKEYLRIMHNILEPVLWKPEEDGLPF